MKFKDLGYRAPPKFLQIAGLGYLLYGLFTGNGVAVQAGIYSGAAGTILDMRANYVNNRIKKLEEKIESLERRV